MHTFLKKIRDNLLDRERKKAFYKAYLIYSLDFTRTKKTTKVVSC
jgi:hypothetical protein